MSLITSNSNGLENLGKDVKKFLDEMAILREKINVIDPRLVFYLQR